MRDARMMRTLMVRDSSVTDVGLFCGIQAWTVDTGDRGQKVQPRFTHSRVYDSDVGDE